jgi:DNA-directed RNA polymerase beta' subunit
MITEIENNPDIMSKDVFEYKIFDVLNIIRDDVSKLIMSNLDPENNFNIMISSGSKGTAENIGQISGTVGLQAFEGGLIPPIYNCRTLAYFHRSDDRSESRGMVKKSFIQGLDFSSFIFHLQTGREGLIDQAIKTATSGYAQRKLVKLLEDVKINYDGSVRTANDTLLQVSYGDSGADTTKQYEYTIKSIEMNNKELEVKHKFSSDELKSYKDYSNDNENVYDNIKHMRDETRVNMIKARANFKTLTTSFMIPVNLKRIVDNRANNKKLTDGEKVKPSYVYEKLEDILDNKHTTLMCMSEKTRKDKTSIKRKDEIMLKTLFRFALYDAISPKRCVIEYNMSKDQFDTIIKDICSDYNDNMAQPGEMCGMLSAQAMGEPLTQMSVAFESIVLIRDMFNKMYYGPIGEFVEKRMQDEIYNVKDIPNHKNSTVLDPIFDHYIYSVAPNETSKWMKIQQLSKHPVNGQLIKIKTKSGRSTITTLSHSHLKRDDHKIVPCIAKNLKVGDRVPIALKINRNITVLIEKIKICNDDIKLTREIGWFFGAYLANGSINNSVISISKIGDCLEDNIRKIAEHFGVIIDVRNYQDENGIRKDIYFTHVQLVKFLDDNFKMGSCEKVLPAFVFNAPEEFQAGIIAGYFDGDCNIDDIKFSIRVESRSQRLIQDIALLLTYFGVFSSICEETTMNYPDKIFYKCEVQRKYCKLFKRSFKLCMPDKIAKLDSFIEANGRHKKITQNTIDMIPVLGDTIYEIGKDLKLLGQSKNYGRYKNKEAIGRETLTKYIKLFKKECKLCVDNKIKTKTINNIKILEDANNSDVVWDAIETIEYIDAPDTYVYDFTVPGTETFMVDCGVFVHNTLNAFHHTGIATMSSVTQGAPRITELMSVTKNLKTPQMIIRLKEEYKTSKEMAHKIASHIKYTTIGDIRGRINVYYDPKPNEKGGFMDQDNVREVFFNNKSTKNGCQADINALPILMRIELNREKMLEKEVTILEIKSKFCSWWEKRFNEAKNMKKEERKVLNKIISLGILSNTDSDKQPVIHIRFNVKDHEKDKFDMETINNFSDMIIDQFKLKGIDGIDSIAGTVPQRMIKFNKDTGSVEAFDEQIILTSGVNISDIRYIIGIDPLNTIINDVVKVYQIFGIEIARNRLYREFALAYEGAGHTVNYQNLSILVDLITSSGAIISVDRHGMSKSDNDPLTRASFEKSVEQLLNAAFFGESDHMKGISSRIMAGMVIKGGTGYPNILLNTEMIEKSEYIDELATVDISYNQILSTNIASDIMKDKKKQEEEVFIPI